MTYNILVVDDDNSQLDTVEHILNDAKHYKTFKASCGKDAIKLLTSEQGSQVDLVLLDLSMPDMSGIDVINAVKPAHPNIPIVVRTGHDDVDLAIEAMKAGADDFLKKMDSIESLRNAITKTIRHKTLQKEFSDLSEKKRSNQICFEDIIGQSTCVKEMIALGRKVSQSVKPQARLIPVLHGDGR